MGNEEERDKKGRKGIKDEESEKKRERKRLDVIGNFSCKLLKEQFKMSLGHKVKHTRVYLPG